MDVALGVFRQGLSDGHGRTITGHRWNYEGYMGYPSLITNIAIEDLPFVVSFPIQNMLIFNSYVKLPEGSRGYSTHTRG